MPIQNSFFDIFKCYELSDSVFLPSVADKSYMLVKQVLYEIDKPTEQFLKSLPLTKMDAIKHLAIGHERKDIDILIGNFLELNIIKYSPWFNFAFSYLNVFFLKCFQRLVTYLRKFLCVYLLSAKCYLIKKKLCRLNVSSNIVKGNKFKAILLIIYGGIGDMVLMSPMLQILNQIMPDVLIDVIVKEKYAGFFESCPLINRIIKYPGNRQIYKWLGEPSIFLRSLHKKYDITIGCCEHFGGDCRWFNGKALSYLLDANIRIGSLDMVSRKYPHITKRFLTHSIKERYEHEAVRMLRLLEPIGLTNLEHQAAVWWEGKAEDTLNKFNISTRLNSKYLIGLSPFTGIQKQWPIDRYAMLIKYIQSNFNVTIILLGAKKKSAGSGYFTLFNW